MNTLLQIHPTREAPLKTTNDLEFSLESIRADLADRIYKSTPGMAAMGERGRRVASMGVQMHLEHLEAAATLQVPEVFSAYISWLMAMLDANGVPPQVVSATLAMLKEACDGLPLGDARSHVESALIAGLGVLASESRGQVEAPGAEAAELVDYLIAGRRTELLGACAKLVSRDGPRAALLVLAGAQHEVGERWMRGEISIGSEHRATALTQLALTTLAPFTAGSLGPRPMGSALVACPEGEWHSTGPRIAADLMELAGFEVEFLGASSPPSEIVAVAREIDAGLVALSATYLASAKEVRRTADLLREELPKARLVAGGWGARKLGPAELGVDMVVGEDFDGRFP